MKDEALKLALEALENSVDLVREDAYNAEKLYGNYPSRQGKVTGLKVLADDHEKAIAAIKQALAAPVQEPVAWMDRDGDLYANEPDKNWCPPHYPLYTTPPAPQQDLQRLSALVRAQQITIDKLEQACSAPVYVKTFHGGKPWPLHPAPVQERNFCERCGKRLGDFIHTCTPPAAQRQWVGLTDEEFWDFVEDSEHNSNGLIRAVEAKLKEKNT
jgi:hypothetical protein